MANLKLCAGCGQTHQRHQRCPTSAARDQARRNKRGYDNPEYQTNRATILRHQPFCQRCGARDDLTVDHITPKARGGTDTLSNLRVLCRHCNSSKGTK